jgi:hypothetical protein
MKRVKRLRRMKGSDKGKGPSKYAERHGISHVDGKEHNKQLVGPNSPFYPDKHARKS